MLEESAFLNRFHTLHQWYRDEFEEVTLNSAAGTPLRVAFRRPLKCRGTLVIVSGRTEFIEKYFDVCRDLSALRLAICIYDHCGQGASGRLLTDAQKGHIDFFDTYVMDLDRVVDHISSAACPNPVFLAGHSMGATISTLYALRYPERIDKLLLCSPMFAIQTGVLLPDIIVKMLAASACRLGLGGRYAPTTGPYHAARAFEGNVLTSDRFRFDYNARLTTHLDYAALGGPTIRWLSEAYKAMGKVQRHGACIVHPVLVLAAAADRVIDAGAAARFACSSSRRSYHKYRDCRHELMMERDEIRNDVLMKMERFLTG